MTVWLMLAAVALLVVFWLRAARRARQNWLASLDLAGRWDLDDADAGPRSLFFSGSLAAGTYQAQDGNRSHRGLWRIDGHSLILEPEAGGRVESDPGPLRYELRLFESGRIGLDGPGRQREIYAKRESNVIPLRRRS